jgi:AcrR family transcriptional regulator
VPKRVDHEERRRQIADALLRTAAARGLHAAGMREVAAEAGVSLRLVQYYFGTKEELMLFAMQQLAAQFAARAMAQISKIKQAQDPVSPRDVIAAILTQALPADDERRTFTVLYTAYFALSLTDPALAIGPLVKNSNAVADVVASQLRAAQAAGDTPAGLDPDLEALSLLAMSAGLGTSILGGQSSPGQAQAVIDYHLDRLFPAPRPALPPSAVTTGSKRQPPGRPISQEQRAQWAPISWSGRRELNPHSQLGRLAVCSAGLLLIVHVTREIAPQLRCSISLGRSLGRKPSRSRICGYWCSLVWSSAP